QASANCPGVIPSDFACFASSLAISKLSRRHSVSMMRLSCRPARVSPAGAWSAAYLPVKDSSSERTIRRHPKSVMGAGRQMLDFGHAVQQVIARLTHYRAIDTGQIAEPRDLSHAPGPEIGDAEIPDLALPDQVSKCMHRLIEWRCMVLFVKKKDVDDVGAKPPQTGFGCLKSAAA